MGRPSSPQVSTELLVAKKPLRTSAILTLAAIAVVAVCASIGFCCVGYSEAGTTPFYSRVTRPRGICLGVRGDAPSYAGYIGLQGDTPDNHRRSFFWWLPASFVFLSHSSPQIIQAFRGRGRRGERPDHVHLLPNLALSLVSHTAVFAA